VVNIQKLYSNAFIVIVDNQSEYVIDIKNVLSEYENVVILDNDSNSKYELGGYIYALKWLRTRDLISQFDYFIFSQDTMILIHKYDMNLLKQNNVKACSLVEFDEKNSSQRGHIPEHDKKRFLEPIGLYNELENITLCWGSNFICVQDKIEPLY
jgi:hypothetical protein